jgi:hypothetical protein
MNELRVLQEIKLLEVLILVTEHPHQKKQQKT